jgi:hypothetical protein
MFLGLPDPHQDPLVTSTDPAQDPSFTTQKNSEKNLDFYCFVTSLWIFTSFPDPHPDPLDRGTRIRLRRSGSYHKCHWSPTLKITNIKASYPPYAWRDVTTLMTGLPYHRWGTWRESRGRAAACFPGAAIRRGRQGRQQQPSLLQLPDWCWCRGGGKATAAADGPQLFSLHCCRLHQQPQY